MQRTDLKWLTEYVAGRNWPPASIATFISKHGLSPIFAIEAASASLHQVEDSGCVLVGHVRLAPTKSPHRTSMLHIRRHDRASPPCLLSCTTQASNPQVRGAGFRLADRPRLTSHRLDSSSNWSIRLVRLLPRWISPDAVQSRSCDNGTNLSSRRLASPVHPTVDAVVARLAAEPRHRQPAAPAGRMGGRSAGRAIQLPERARVRAERRSG